MLQPQPVNGLAALANTCFSEFEPALFDTPIISQDILR
jgi:hypothetical protein